MAAMQGYRATEAQMPTRSSLQISIVELNAAELARDDLCGLLAVQSR
jgi:hypothetical protein